MSRILIVEDSPTQAERLRLVLEEDGFDAEVAGDGETALERLAASSFDMVISDIEMPGLSGYELCQKIKAKPAWRNIPVILLTTHKDPMDIFQGLECGADGFHTKPYDSDRLIVRIRTIFQNKAHRSLSKLKVGVEISLFGQTFVIGSEKEQILDLLISTFEDIVRANLDLEKSQRDLSAAKAKIEEYTHLLEARVRTSEEKNRAIIESVTEGIITIDERGIINSINPAAQSIFSYAAGEVIGQNVNVLMPKPYHSRHDSYLEAYRSTGIEKIIGKGMREIEGRRKDGTVFPLNLSVSEMNVGGQREFIGVTRDLTSEKATQMQLYQAQKMESVGQLAGGIAHDFNNLLAIIIGNLDILKEGIEADPDRSELVNGCISAVMRGADLTRSLLAFSRRQPLKPQSVFVPKLVDGFAEMLKRTLGEQIRIIVQAKEKIWPVNLDVAMLETTILNLCINARDAMPDGGDLTIEITNKQLDKNYAAENTDVVPGDYVMLAVSDTGMGIPPEILSRVFEPFFTTKDPDKGTGLGLSLIYGFAKQSGGNVKIYSEVGVGTTVRLYLPRDAGEEAAAPSSAEEPEIPVAAQGETIFVVEDNLSLRQTVVRQLKGLGYRVIEAEAGAAALELLKQGQPIDLLFTDIVMPNGMTGADLASAARKLRPTLKVLFTSGFPDLSTNQRFNIDGDILINKPYRRRDLALKIREVLNRKD